MPEFNRRRFLQMASAAGLAPALPALSLPATAAPVGTATSRMLWASLSARAGSAARFTGVAQTLGIPSQTAQGVYAKAIQSQVFASQGASGIRQILQPKPPTAAPPKSQLSVDIENLLADDLEDASALAPPDTTDETAAIDITGDPSQ